MPFFLQCVIISLEKKQNNSRIMKRQILLTLAFFLCLTSLSLAQQKITDNDIEVEKQSQDVSNAFFKNLSSGYTLTPEFKVGGTFNPDPKRNFTPTRHLRYAGDLNGDGRSDFYYQVVTADENTPDLTDRVSKMVFYYGSESGIIEGDPIRVENLFHYRADLTGDGIPEGIRTVGSRIIIVSDQSSGELSNLIEKEVLVTTPGGLESYGDFNGDGYDDIIVYESRINSTKFYPDEVRELFIIKGGESLDDITIDTLIYPLGLDEGFGQFLYSDVDSDGEMDIIEVASLKGDNPLLVISVYQKQGKDLIEMDRDTVSTGTSFKYNSMYSGEIGVLDMNSDGKEELVILTGGQLRVFSLDETEGEYYGENTAIGQVYTSASTAIQKFAIIDDFDNNGAQEILLTGETLQLISSDPSLELSTETLPKNDGEYFVLPVNLTKNWNSGGDVNGDGINDIVVGFFNIEDNGYGYRTYFGNSSGSFDNSNDLNIESINPPDTPRYVLSLGDINVDGIDDFGIVYSENSRVEIFFGKAFSDNITADIVISDPEKPLYYSPSIGDFNGDGVPDLLVPTRFSTWETPDSRLNIYYGGVNFDNIEDHTIYAKDSYPGMQASIGNAQSIGDINGDGFDDIMYASEDSEVNTFIILGGTSMSTGPDITFPFFASNFSKVGDFNNDGLKDFAVAVNNSVRIYSGFDEANGEEFNMEPLTILADPSSEVNPITTILYFGHSIAPGDYNGDGIVDLAVTSIYHYKYNSNHTLGQGAEAVRIYQGGSNLDSLVVGKIFLLAKDFASTSYTQGLDTLNQNMSTISRVPDQNNDGADELILSTGGFKTTNAAVYYGGDLDTMGTNIGILLEAPNPSLALGPTASYLYAGRGIPAVGDFNGDNKNDYLLPQMGDFNFVIDPVYIFTADQLFVSKEEEQITQISDFSLNQNYPNPFNPTSIISYNLPIASSVSLKVYDVTGRLVSTLINNQKTTAGTHSVTVNAREWSSGVYFYRLEADGFVATKKLTLIK